MPIIDPPNALSAQSDHFFMLTDINLALKTVGQF